MVQIIGVVSLTIFLPLGTTAISRETLIENNRKTAETDAWTTTCRLATRARRSALEEEHWTQRETGSCQQFIAKI